MKRITPALFVYFCLILSCSKKNAAEKWNELFWEAYEVKDYDKAFVYAEKSAALGDPNGEYWMGWWALNGDENQAACFDWFKKAASQGDYGALVKLGELYETGFAYIANDYEEARRCYEAALASNSDDEDLLEALDRLPAIGDYPALFAKALDGAVFGPNYPLAFMYAVKGGFADADFDNPVCEPMEIHCPAGSRKSAMGTLVDLAVEQIFSLKGKDYRMVDDYIIFFRASENVGGENLRRLLAELEENGL